MHIKPKGLDAHVSVDGKPLPPRDADGLNTVTIVDYDHNEKLKSAKPSPAAANTPSASPMKQAAANTLAETANVQKTIVDRAQQTVKAQANAAADTARQAEQVYAANTVKAVENLPDTPTAAAATPLTALMQMSFAVPLYTLKMTSMWLQQFQKGASGQQNTWQSPGITPAV